MKDMNGVTVKPGDVLISEDPMNIREVSRYVVSHLGTFENSDIIIHPVYNGKPYPNLARYLNSSWAEFCYQVSGTDLGDTL